MKNKISIVIQALTLLFTAAILVILLIPQSNHVISSDSDYVATTISNERAMRDYKLKIGEKYISVSNDKITKSSYPYAPPTYGETILNRASRQASRSCCNTACEHTAR